MNRTDSITLLLVSGLTFAGLGLASGHWAAVGLGVGLGLAGGFYGLTKMYEAIARVPDLNPAAGQNAVFGAIVGTMLGRMIVLGAGLAMGLGVLELDPIWIVLGFFSLYIVAQTLEVRLALRTKDIQPAQGS